MPAVHYRWPQLWLWLPSLFGCGASSFSLMKSLSILSLPGCGILPICGDRGILEASFLILETITSWQGPRSRWVLNTSNPHPCLVPPLSASPSLLLSFWRKTLCLISLVCRRSSTKQERMKALFQWSNILEQGISWTMEAKNRIRAKQEKSPDYNRVDCPNVYL